MMQAEATGTDVYSLIATRARETPKAPALSDAALTLDYNVVITTVDAIAAGLSARGIGRGDRVAVLSENCIEYALLQIACAKLGVIVACQNWRLSSAELRYCMDLVAPSLMVTSPRFRKTAAEVADAVPVATFDALPAYGETEATARPEDILLIIYTSGTTGLPKAAMISHRAEIARMSATRLDLGIGPGDGYIAWAPMYHMGGTEHLLTTLMSGGHGFVIDGFDAAAIAGIVAENPIGWLMLVPATIKPMVAELKRRAITPRGVRAVGCMADLVPAADIAAIANAVNAPYLNSFGSTETGMPPLSGGLIPPCGPTGNLAKHLSVLTELRLVGTDGQTVKYGEVGEAWVRGPTLFSGYWDARAANTDCFHDGWYRMGDLFQQTACGYEFVGRSKYLIKSGGENIYPAEIERLLLADPRVADAIVVRAPDAHWGEVPVAVVARADSTLDSGAVEALLAGSLARYKRPRVIFFIDLEDFPRNASGKIQREAVELLISTET